LLLTAVAVLYVPEWERPLGFMHAALDHLFFKVLFLKVPRPGSSLNPLGCTNKDVLSLIKSFGPLTRSST